LQQTAKVFELNIFGKMRYCCLGILCAVAGSFMFSITPNSLWSVWFELFDIAMVLSGVYFAAFAFCYRVIFDKESVTVAGPLFLYSLKLSEVNGRRRIRNWRSSWLNYNLLEAQNPEAKSLMIIDDLGFNREWDDWFSRLPNLDNRQKPKTCFKKTARKRQKRLQE